MTNETKCSCGKPKYIGREVCYDCYEQMFHDYKEKFPLKKIDLDEEPDFVIKSDVAEISPSGSGRAYLDADIDMSKLVYTGSGYIKFNMPKQVVLNPDAIKDYEKLVVFLLDNMMIYDNAKGFDKVSYMFKEYKEEKK